MAEPDDLLRRLQALLPKASAHLAWVRASVGSDVRLIAVDEVCYLQATDKYTAVFTRDASLARIRTYLPPELELETVRGIRVVTPVSFVHRWPVVGPALRAIERGVADLPGLRRLGGFLLVVARKRP